MLHQKLKKKKDELTSPTGLFKNETGAIDLASIMVGIVVIGLIGGIIAATVFAVIPWSQDNAAKHQLDSIVVAESAYMGLASDPTATLPSNAAPNSYADSALLSNATLLKTGPTYCAVTTDGGKGYAGYSQSASGKIWTVTDKSTKPVLMTSTLPAACQFITDGQPTTSTPPVFVDPTPTLTKFTYQCSSTTIGSLPLKDGVTGTETWDNGLPSQTYTNAAYASNRTLTAGVKYSVTFDGTYKTLNAQNITNSAASDLAKCLISVDYLGSSTGVTNMNYGYGNAPKLVDVPERIPSTVTSLAFLFSGSTSINDPDISKWDTSNVTSFSNTFSGATSFNQPLSGWKTDSVTSMYAMFYGASAFNQDISSWNTINVTDMSSMFYNAVNFDKPLNAWKVGNVQKMNYMFSTSTTSAFNQPLDTWDTSKVTDMSNMFDRAAKFNQNISMWNTTKLTSIAVKFVPVTFPDNYMPLRTSK